MEGARTAEEIRSAFRELAASDRARGRLRPLAEYQRLFAGCDDLVAAEYARLAAEPRGRPDSHDGITVESGPSPQPTVATGARGAPVPDADLGRIGPYRLVRELGSGGMGRVYRAVCEGRAAGIRAGQDVALKVVHAHLAAGEGFFKRFLREAEIGKKVRHPNVVRTLDVDAAVLDGKSVHYLVMEYVEGQTLRSLLAEVGKVPEALCLHVAREAARGLAAIHEIGVVHRDFKPENVLITRDHAVKVMDLGVARLADEAVRPSLTGAFVGTVPYAAPEQFLAGGKDIDGRADLYALGLTLYELSTGLHPFADEDLMAVLRRRLHEDPKPPSILNPQLSPFFEEVVKTLVARDREKRFASAAEMAGVLDQGEESAWWRRRSGEIRAVMRRPLRRIRIPRETALFGRDTELSRLRALWEKAKAGEGQVVLVEGEAGIGKSRLVDELAGLLQQEGEDLNFLYGSYPPGGAATAAGAFSTAYREQFGAEDLEGALGPHLASTPLLVPAFAALLRGEPPPKGTEPLSKESLQTAFVEATRALARDRPTVVLVDDLHFAPEEGRALLMALALAIPGHRVLLVGTARPGLPAEWTAGLDRLGHTSRVALGRLGPKDLQQLLVEAFRSESLAEDLGGRIGAKSDGNPFFVLEILRSLREGGALRRNPDGTWVKTSGFREIEIPSSVTDLIRARTARLDEQERNLLDVAACCGFEFDPLLVGEALGLGRIPVLQRLAGIEKAHRLVRSAGRRFVFDHHQVQEVLYTGLPDLLREEYHATLGEALEGREGVATKDPKDLPGALAVKLCEHHLKGGRGEKARRYLDAALTHLEGAYWNDAAIDLATRILAIPGLVHGRDRVEVLLRTAARLNMLLRREQEGRAVEEAVALADADGDAGLRARARMSLGWYQFWMVRTKEAEETVREVLALAREAGDRETEARATGHLGNVLRELGRSEDAAAQLERSLAMAKKIGDRRGEAAASGNLGLLFLTLGRYEEARPLLEHSLGIAREMGDRRGEGVSGGNLGCVLTALGDYAGGRAWTERSLTLTKEVGFRMAAIGNNMNLSVSLHGLGLLAEAREAVERGAAQEADVPLPWFVPQMRIALAEVMLSEGRSREAEDILREAIAVPLEERHRVRTAKGVLALGSLLVRAGRSEEAGPFLEEARRMGAARSDLDLEVVALAYQAAAGTAEASAAAEALARLEKRLYVSSRMEARLALFRASGNREHLDEAKRLLDEVLSRAPEECREGMVRNVRLHREIDEAWKERGKAP